MWTPIRVKHVQHLSCHLPPNSLGKRVSHKGTAVWMGHSSCVCENTPFEAYSGGEEERFKMAGGNDLA